MTKNKHLIEKARQLRLSGRTLPEICEMLDRSKTTVYYWIKDIELDLEAKEKIKSNERTSLARQRGYAAVRKKNTDLRDAAYAEGLAYYQENKDDKFFRDFILIYLTEGFRKTRNRVEVCNSNINMIKLSNDIIKKLSNRRVTYRIQYHIDQDIDQLRKIWSDALNISKDEIQFTLKGNSGGLKGRNWNCVNGVMIVCTSDTYFRSKVQAWMDCVEQEWKENL